MATDTTIFHGLNIHWGISASFAGVIGIPQNLDGDFKADIWTGRDQRGCEVAFNSYNFVKAANFEYYVTDGNAPAGNALISGSYPERGIMLTVTSGESNNPFADTNWIVTDYNIRETNTDATKIILKATSYQGITT